MPLLVYPNGDPRYNHLPCLNPPFAIFMRDVFLPSVAQVGSCTKDGWERRRRITDVWPWIR